MKRILVVAVLLVSFFASVNANAQFANVEDEVEFKSTTHDFETINEDDGPVSHSFKFTNNSNSVVIITDVKASCGCTSPDWTKQPIMKGKEGFIKATYNPKNRPGGFNKTLTVNYTVNNETKTVKLTIKGSVASSK